MELKLTGPSEDVERAISLLGLTDKSIKKQDSIGGVDIVTAVFIHLSAMAIAEILKIVAEKSVHFVRIKIMHDGKDLDNSQDDDVDNPDK